MISACKTGSAKRVTAVLPLFPYSRQPDLPYNKIGAPLSKPQSDAPRDNYTFESVPATPGPHIAKSAGLNNVDLAKALSRATSTNGIASPRVPAPPFHAQPTNGDSSHHHNSNGNGTTSNSSNNHNNDKGKFTTHDYENNSVLSAFQAKPGYKRWVAQAGTLVADLLTCAGADQ